MKLPALLLYIGARRNRSRNDRSRDIRSDIGVDARASGSRVARALGAEITRLICRDMIMRRSLKRERIERVSAPLPSRGYSLPPFALPLGTLLHARSAGTRVSVVSKTKIAHDGPPTRGLAAPFPFFARVPRISSYAPSVQPLSLGDLSP